MNGLQELAVDLASNTLAADQVDLQVVDQLGWQWDGPGEYRTVSVGTGRRRGTPADLERCDPTIIRSPDWPALTAWNWTLFAVPGPTNLGSHGAAWVREKGGNHVMQRAISAERPSDDSSTRATRALLACGAIAAPLFAAVAVIEMFTRQGFDLRRHDLSLLSNGDLGWIQIANFVVAGLLVVAGAVGIKRAIPSGRASTWGPWLLGIYGLGWIGAGLFVADPMNGFPPGTPDGFPTNASWHSWMHLASGSVGFLALIAACVVFARRFASTGRRGWMAYSIVTAILVLAAVVGISSGSQQAAVIIAFFMAGILSLVWISALSFRLISETRAPAA